MNDNKFMVGELYEDIFEISFKKYLREIAADNFNSFFHYFINCSFFYNINNIRNDKTIYG